MAHASTDNEVRNVISANRGVRAASRHVHNVVYQLPGSDNALEWGQVTSTYTCTCTQKPPPFRSFLCRISSFDIIPGTKSCTTCPHAGTGILACDTEAWVVVGALQDVPLLELCFSRCFRKRNGERADLDVVFDATEELGEPVRFRPVRHQHVPPEPLPKSHVLTSPTQSPSPPSTV